jgi:hypothetical protein
MQAEPGDIYVRRIAGFVRTHEKSLAAAQLAKARQPEPVAGSVLNPMNWFGPSALSTPVVLAFDTHHLYYLLIRLEGIGLSVGSLDVKVSNPSRPMDYIDFSPKPDRSDTMSLASIRSTLSVVSNLSLGASWWRNTEPPSTEAELKYLFSSFTKLPALSIQPPGPKVIAELEHNANAIPLHCFRNLQSLECVDIDPRVLLGWDLLADRLRSLRIRKSGLTNLCDFFINSVLSEDASQLSANKWTSLKFLSLSDNAITFFPSELLPHFKFLTHLDLSHNLLVSVPHGLDVLVNMTTLNLAHNMIDSLLGIYTNLGQVHVINLSHNRIESICGLERLLGLERVDLRGNMIEESSEIGRLAILPHIAQVWVEGNFFCEYEDAYRAEVFSYFHKEGKTITLDGIAPSYYEKQNLPSNQEPSAQSVVHAPISKLPTPPTLPTTVAALPQSIPIETRKVIQPRKKKPKRVIDLSGEPPSRRQVSESAAPPAGGVASSPPRHQRYWSDIASPARTPSPPSQQFAFPKSDGHGHVRRASGSSPLEGESAELFRRRMEHLKQDMGESWLKVFSQSQTPATTTS